MTPSLLIELGGLTLYVANWRSFGYLSQRFLIQMAKPSSDLINFCIGIKHANACFKNVIVMCKNVVILDFLLKLKENWACNELKQSRGMISHDFKFLTLYLKKFTS